MNSKNLSHSSKVHLFFGCGLMAVIFISSATGLFSGQSLASALLEALSQIRPVEYGMYFSFWYWLARDQQDTFRSGFTSLNLREHKS